MAAINPNLLHKILTIDGMMILAGPNMDMNCEHYECVVWSMSSENINLLFKQKGIEIEIWAKF